MEIKEQLRAFVTSIFYFTDKSRLENDASSLDLGIIDLTDLIKVIFLIKEAFGTTPKDSKMLPDNLDFIERITNFVTRKKRMSFPSSVADSINNFLGDHP